MILHRIAVANTGPFTGAPLDVGPFAPGLNILTAPNETGKTTLLKAAGRALFDRHTCKADEIKNLRPAGTTLAPAITVDFQTGAGRFQIEKTFLQAPKSQLSEHQGGEWKLLADGDGADDRLNALLQSQKPGSGATKIAHWGMLGYLWMRQGEAAEWPEWHRIPVGQIVQGMLVKVEIDPFIETVRGRMWSIFTENFTPSTNQPKVGGTLLAGEEELARVEAELAGLARTREQIQADQDAFERWSAELPRLAGEQARRREAAELLREAAGQARVLQAEVEKCRHVLETARDRLRSVQGDQDALRDHARRAAELTGKLQGARQEGKRLAREAGAARGALRTAEGAQEAAARLLAAAQAEATRASQLLRHRRLHEDIARATQVLERGAVHAAALDRLTAERAEMPTLPPAKLARLEKLHEAIRTNRTRLEALGLTVEIVSTEGATVTVRLDQGEPAVLPELAAGEVRKLHAAQAVTLGLPGWGKVRVQSGAGEARALRDTLSADEETLRQELAHAGASTLAAARDLVERTRELDRRTEAARQALANASGDAGESPDALRARLARDRRQLELLASELALTPPELAASTADLDAAEQAATVRCQGRRAEGKNLDRKVKEAREAADALAGAAERAERDVLLLQAEAANLEKTIASVGSRYPAGPEAAYQAAIESFGVASHGLKMAEQTLPPEADTLPERNRRAAVAAEQVSVELERCRAQVAELRGRLELQGSSGLHRRESDMAIRREALRVQVAQARSRSRAARLVHDLIERRKEAATRAVLVPLQDRLSARFAEVSGERERRIFLDESLTVRGLGRKDGELVNFNDLSQGAKEQLLLCLRLAIAEELVAGGGGPQSLILDDVLVNTDAARQERILTLLGNAAASGLQILVCTCHPDRYRGVGQVIALRRG